ncbi:MAG: PIN domain-containing protein [Bryobacterales bacterium]|nr:PIN domain-containing protein [Bryobacterales bacterium]MDE0625765.1 PIN domain-containing protein [Bryobacterales bacterium]
MIIVDTSIWVEVLRDSRKRGQVEGALAGADAYLTRFTQMELLVGAGREDQWSRLERYLSVQKYAEADSSTWRDAARTYYELRRMGKTVRSPIDCCIAEITIAHDASLLHRDRDFRAIASVRPLRERWLDL